MRMNICVLGLVGAVATFCVGCGGGVAAAPRSETPTTSGANDGAAGDRRGDVGGNWEKLGERGVSGKVDNDTIAVGRSEGKFTTLRVKVEDSALEMYDIVVYFGDGTSFSPKTRLVFKQGVTSNNIDLGGKRVITKVDFKYGNVPGGGNAKVELWGK